MRRVVGELEQRRKRKNPRRGYKNPPPRHRIQDQGEGGGIPCGGEWDGWKRTGADDDGDLAKNHGRSLVDCSATSAAFAFALRRAGRGWGPARDGGGG